MVTMIISGTIFGICALIMFGIGISQLKSEKPVGFYTGEKGPDASQLTDVKAWNQKHGIMWIVYGCCIVASWVCGLIIGDNILTLIPFTLGLVVPVFFMAAYHNRLIKKYFVSQ